MSYTTSRILHTSTYVAPLINSAWFVALSPHPSLRDITQQQQQWHTRFLLSGLKTYRSTVSSVETLHRHARHVNRLEYGHREVSVAKGHASSWYAYVVVRAFLLLVFSQRLERVRKSSDERMGLCFHLVRQKPTTTSRPPPLQGRGG